MDNTLAKLKLIKDTGDSGRMAYDQMIGDNPAGNKLVQDAVDALIAQTRATEAHRCDARFDDRARRLGQPGQSVRRSVRG